MQDARRHSPGTPVWVNLETVAGTTAASQFYGALFGWTALARHRPSEDASHWWVFMLDGLDVASLAPGRQPGWEMYMSVDNADETTRVVVDNGGAVAIWDEIDDVARLVVCTDPLGARFGLWEPKTHPAASRMHEPNSFTWGELSCRDIDAAKDFYGAVFGWQGRTSPFAEGSTYTEFFLDEGDEAVAGMVQMNELWPEDVPPHWMLYFAVADTDEIAGRVGHLGGKVSVAPFDLADVGRIAVLNDPEGAVFSVLQRP